MSNKLPNLVTPRGTALWPRLTTPDTKFNAEGKFKTSMVLTAEDSEDLRAKLDTIAEESLAAAIEAEKDAKKKAALQKFTYNSPCKPELDDNGNETGNFVFGFSTNAKDKSGKLKKLAVVDAKRRPVKEIVGHGSEIKVSFSPKGYQMPSSKTYGVSLYLNAVQVLTLVEPGLGGASVFDDEEGFESSGVEGGKGGEGGDAFASTEEQASGSNF